MPAFLLVHSPLVGPYTWKLVADELRRLGNSVVVPHLSNDEQNQLPYVEQHVGRIAQACKEQIAGSDVVLVGHSGAGMLLPYAGQQIGRVAGYIFVDAGLPSHGKSRLATFPPDEAKHFRQVAANGYIPFWGEEILAQVIPDPDTRRNFVSDLRPVPLAVYEEPIPVPSDWPDAPCAYLCFTGSSSYADAAKAARERGWAYDELPGYHFHTLVDPVAVAESLVQLTQAMSIGT